MSFLPLHTITEIELSQVSNYLTTLQSFLENNEKKFVEEIERSAESIAAEDRDDFYEAYSDEYSEVKEVFPHLLCSGFLVTWYSFMEDILFDISIQLGLEKRGGYRPGIPEIQKRLEKKFGDKLDKKLWDELNCIRETRNSIVHRKGLIHIMFEEGRGTQPFSYQGETYFLILSSELLEHLQRHNLISPHGTFVIWPDFNYCKFLLDFSNTFLKTLLNSLNLK